MFPPIVHVCLTVHLGFHCLFVVPCMKFAFFSCFGDFNTMRAPLMISVLKSKLFEFQFLRPTFEVQGSLRRARYCVVHVSIIFYESSTLIDKTLSSNTQDDSHSLLFFLFLMWFPCYQTTLYYKLLLFVYVQCFDKYEIIFSSFFNQETQQLNRQCLCSIQVRNTSYWRNVFSFQHSSLSSCVFLWLRVDKAPINKSFFSFLIAHLLRIPYFPWPILSVGSHIPINRKIHYSIIVLFQFIRPTFGVQSSVRRIRYQE